MLALVCTRSASWRTGRSSDDLCQDAAWTRHSVEAYRTLWDLTKPGSTGPDPRCVTYCLTGAFALVAISSVGRGHEE
jgi:hypothetical protein